MLKKIKTKREYVLCGSDFSQQEPRLLSAFSGDDAMINSYRQGKDLYATLASRIFSNGYWDNMEHFEDGTPNPEGKKRRSKTKRLLLGIMYGMGAASIAVSIDGTVEEAQEIIDNFYKGFPTVKKWMDVSKENAKKYGYVEDIWGRRRRLPDIQLKPYQVEFKDKTKNDGDFNPLLGSLGLVKNDTSKLLDEYYNKAIKTKSRKEVEELASKAEKDGIILHSNSNKIAQAERQCVNARIQGCLDYNTLINTLEYGIVPIGKIDGEHIHIWDGNIFSKADIVASGKKKKCIIEFSNKQTIVCSPDHKFKTVNTRGREIFKKCSELKIGERIRNNINLFDSSYKYTSVKKEQKVHNANMFYLDDISNSFIRGQVLGRLASDGSYSNDGEHKILTWLVAEHELDVLEFLKTNIPYKYSIHENSSYSSTGKKRNQKIYQLQVTSQCLLNEIKELDIKHHIDPKIFQDTNMLRGFISGMFDGDGTCSGNNISLTFGIQYDFMEYLKDIQKALLFFGIRSRIYKFKDCYKVSIYKADSKLFAERIGFIHKDKQQKANIKKTVYDEHIFGKVLIIKNISMLNEDIDMYDVCDTENGYFVADGIVVHNSAATMSKKAMIKVHNDKTLNDLDFHMLIAVHDELIGECPAEYADQVAERLTDVMKHAAEPDVIVPFKCDPTIEKSWYYSDYSDVLNEEYQKRIDKGENQKDVLTDIFSSHSECTPEQLCEMLNINADLLDKIMNS